MNCQMFSLQQITGANPGDNLGWERGLMPTWELPASQNYSTILEYPSKVVFLNFRPLLCRVKITEIFCTTFEGSKSRVPAPSESDTVN